MSGGGHGGLRRGAEGGAVVGDNGGVGARVRLRARMRVTVTVTVTMTVRGRARVKVGVRVRGRLGPRTRWRSMCPASPCGSKSHTVHSCHRSEMEDLHTTVVLLTS